MIDEEVFEVNKCYYQLSGAILHHSLMPGDQYHYCTLIREGPDQWVWCDNEHIGTGFKWMDIRSKLAYYSFVLLYRKTELLYFEQQQLQKRQMQPSQLKQQVQQQLQQEVQQLQQEVQQQQQLQSQHGQELQTLLVKLQLQQLQPIQFQSLQLQRKIQEQQIQPQQLKQQIQQRQKEMQQELQKIQKEMQQEILLLQSQQLQEKFKQILQQLKQRQQQQLFLLRRKLKQQLEEAQLENSLELELELLLQQQHLLEQLQLHLRQLQLLQIQIQQVLSSTKLVPSSTRPLLLSKKPGSYPNPEFCGLNNLNGVTCYVNSSLQLLYTATRIRKYVIEHSNVGPAHCCLSKLFLSMETEARRNKEKTATMNKQGQPVVVYVKTEEFVNKIQQIRPHILPLEMSDAHEFLSALIQLLHEEANQLDKKQITHTPATEPLTAIEAYNHHVRNVDNSFFSQMFMGQLENILRCLTCSHISKTWCCMWQLQTTILPIITSIPERVRMLNECLHEYAEGQVR